MAAGHDWHSRLAGDVCSRVAACLAWRRVECLKRPEKKYFIWAIRMCTIPEGIYELGKLFLASRRIAGTCSIHKLYPRYGKPTYEIKATIVHVMTDWARHCYLEWKWAWEEFEARWRSTRAECSPCPLVRNGVQCGSPCTAHKYGAANAYCSHSLPRVQVHEWTSVPGQGSAQKRKRPRLP